MKQPKIEDFRTPDLFIDLASFAKAQTIYIKKLLNALKEIAKGEGRYDMDRLKHAQNTIEDMIKLANEATETK